MASGLAMLQAALDRADDPDDWPDDVCRNAFCGYWERSEGLYYPHTPGDHTDGVDHAGSCSAPSGEHDDGDPMLRDKPEGHGGDHWNADVGLFEEADRGE